MTAKSQNLIFKYGIKNLFVKKNFITILITNFNKFKFLKKTLDSIIKQNYNYYEVIIFDDCSTDESLKIINKYVKKFKNFKLIKNNNKKFLSPALNQINGVSKIFNHSKGSIICLMDADDYFKKDKLRLINQYFTDNKKDRIVYDLPSTSKSQFKFRNKKSDNIWPTIFPTSCISVRKKNFKLFLKFLNKTNFPNLEIDARIIIFFKFYFNEYNLIKKKLTIYNFANNSITANINKFSKKWWKRRLNGFEYMKIILKLKNRKFKKSSDYLITKFLNIFI